MNILREIGRGGGSAIASDENTEPEAFYRERLSGLRAEHGLALARTTRLLFALLGAVLLTGLVLAAAVRALLPAWTAVVPLLAGVTVTAAWLGSRRKLHRLDRLIDLYNAGSARLAHQPPARPQTGEAFREAKHGYERDLNILGPDSLFERLATTRTGQGQRALAGMLLHPASLDETLERQAAIQELAPASKLREAIALLGPNALVTSPDTFDLWLRQPAVGLPSWLGPVLYGCSAVVALLTVAWATGPLRLDGFLRNLAGVLACQGAIALRERGKIVPLLEATAPLPSQVQILIQAFALLRGQTFRAPGLQRLQEQTASAGTALDELQRLLLVVEQRKTEWFYLPALAVNAGTHAALGIDRWKTVHGASMARWLAAWAAFDAWCALATYAFEHPGNAYPEMLGADAPAAFEADGLMHPLLPGAIGNEVRLGPGTRFYLISGSNMSGKSTLLRAMGLAVVLARAGAPIAAVRARMSPLALGVSIAVSDSLAEGKSRFLAEIERLQLVLGLARGAPTLFLIDELLSGTNSADRLTAAEAVMDALLRAGAIGALSTHDLALTTLATEARAGTNRHMASPNQEDPLGFDYLLKPGSSTASNALAFLRLLDLDQA